MARYMAFVEEPVEPADFDVEFDPEASLTENQQKLAEAIGIENLELYYTMSKFYAVGIFEAPDNKAAEQIVRNVHQTADVKTEVVPIFSSSEIEE